jgi:serine/threonine protein kinase
MVGTPGDPFGWVGHTADGKYQVEACVGEGGFGVVYRAKHLGFGEMVAFKCLRVPPELGEGEERERFFESFLHEGKLQHRLSRMTAGIVQALDVGEATAPSGIWTPYLVLEWLEGRTLEMDMDERHRLGMRGRPLHEALALLDPVARALELAHEQGVAHRDVKPANLFLSEIGGRQTIKVLDFGIAKVITETASVTRAFEKTGRTLQAFTAHYGAPEQFARRFGATGPWTDVFALALVLVELVSGERALEGEDAAELFVSAADDKHRPTLRARGVQVSDDLEDVMKVALMVDPRERFRTMGEFWDALCDAADWVARPPMSSAHAAVIVEPATRASQADVDQLVAGSPKARSPETQLSSSTQVPVEPRARHVTLIPILMSKRKLVLAVAGGSLAAGALVGTVGYLLSARTPSPPPVASFTASTALSRDTRGRAPASSAPLASASARGATDVPLFLTLPSGDVLGSNLWLPEFKLEQLPEDAGRTLLEAESRCQDAGLSLCTEQQLVRACSLDADLAKDPSWTLTGQAHGFVIRGGGACSARDVAPAGSIAPTRRAPCCERAVAVESGNSNKNFLLATSRMLEKVEAALNARRSSVFLGLVAEGMVIDGESRTLDQIAKLLDASYQKYPDQWMLIDTCSVSMKPPARSKAEERRAGKKHARVQESASWSAECEVVKQRAGDFSVVTTRYVIAATGRLQSIEDIRTTRKWSKP